MVDDKTLFYISFSMLIFIILLGNIFFWLLKRKQRERE